MCNGKVQFELTRSNTNNSSTESNLTYINFTKHNYNKLLCANTIIFIEKILTININSHYDLSRNSPNIRSYFTAPDHDRQLPARPSIITSKICKRKSDKSKSFTYKRFIRTETNLISIFFPGSIYESHSVRCNMHQFFFRTLFSGRFNSASNLPATREFSLLFARLYNE